MNNLMQEFKMMNYRICVLEKILSKLLLLRTNGVNNKVQSILDLIDSDTVEFVYTEDGKVKANAIGAGSIGITLEVLDNFSDIVVSGVKRFIYVITDETNNGDTSLYLYSGIGLKFLQTIA